MRGHQTIFATGAALALSWSVSAAAQSQSAKEEPKAKTENRPENAAKKTVEPKPFKKSLEVRPRNHWYGYQTLLSDGLSFSLLLGSADSEAFGWAGLIGYGLGPAAIHGNHGEWLSAGLSVGMRFALPYLGAKIGSDPEPFFGFDAGALLGVFVGITAAVVLDSTVLARTKVPGKDKTAGLAPSFRPLLLQSKQGSLLGLAGTF